MQEQRRLRDGYLLVWREVEVRICGLFDAMPAVADEKVVINRY